MNNKENISVRFLYNTFIGRFFLRLLINPKISKLAGRFLSSRLSKFIVPSFVKKHKIDLSEYKRQTFDSFNDFFIRERASVNFDHSPSVLISPSDGYLTVYKINSDSKYKIKNTVYSVGELLNDEALAEKYVNGLCFVFRLAPDNFHRYLFPDDGVMRENHVIKGVLHCVRPVAADKYPIYIRNSREYAVLDTARFGTVIQVEVGALLVGKIHNHPNKNSFLRGEEKGYFEFGGSTIILLFEQNTVIPDKSITENTEKGKETPVKAGEKIGTAV